MRGAGTRRRYGPELLIQGQATALKGTQGGTDVARRSVRADPELVQFPAPFVRPYPLDTRQERPRGDETRHEGVTSRAIEVTAFQSGLSEVNGQNSGVNVDPARPGQPELVGAERVPDQLSTR